MSERDLSNITSVELTFVSREAIRVVPARPWKPVNRGGRR
jgi:hypothetical protein